MKIIFLDVDGVLNSWLRGKPMCLSKGCLRRLKYLVDQTGAQIVLSSSWREFPEATRKLQRVLSYRGMKFIGQTPILNHRDLEINVWLKEHEEVSEFVILDDIDFFSGDPTLIKHFVHTNGDIGLSDNDVKKAIEILNRR